MDNTQRVTLELDLDNEMVADWFTRLMEGVRHPVYQNGIRIVKNPQLE